MNPPVLIGIDAFLPDLLTWLVSRYDSVGGGFFGMGDEAEVPPALMTAQAAACLEALGLHARLPHVVRAKLGTWPALPMAEYNHAARGTPFAAEMRAALGADSGKFARALAPFAASDGGYSLTLSANEPGSMAAAHHLLVDIRPAWFRQQRLALPALEESVAARFADRLLPAFAP